jgi:hypothetical protein
MSRKIILAACVLFVLAFGVPAASAAPIQLLLPQSSAFAVLGHSCGGIQEKTYATGFDAASGYPAGDVYLSTSCGGSGRGGGYHTTTYTAWVSVSWDFTATVLTYAALSTAPAVNPTLSVFDANGNQLYNQSGGAYLVRATGFVPAPRLTSISPTTGPASGGTKVTIAGTGFTGATSVSFGATAANFTVVSDTTITATSPASAAGTIDVTVANAGGASAASATDQFTFVLAPSVTSVAPRTGPVGGGTEVTITGTNLAAATQVSFGGTPAQFWATSDTTITAISPAAEGAESVYVRVTSVGGKSATGTNTRFTYTVSTPVVTGVDPNSGSSDGGTWVTITGANFTDATEVDFGGVATYFVVDDDSTIEAMSPPAAAGTVDVTVKAYTTTSARSAADLFTFVQPLPPSVTGIDPSAGPAGGGTVATITGTGFTNAAEVDFGGVATYFVVVDDSTIEAVSPGGAAGPVDVTVATSDGTISAATAADQFTYLAAPAVSGVDPSTGPVAGGTSVTISGTGFADAVEVDFGGTPADYVVNDDTSITATAPAGTAGTIDVTVTSAGGTSAATADDQYTYSG